MNTTTQWEVNDLPGAAGVKPVEIPVTKYLQGERIHYHAALPISQAVRLIQRPDPSRPLPGNRRVDPARSRRFGEYLTRNRDWVSPSLLVRVPRGEVGFAVKASLGSDTSWGVLTIPLDVLSEVTVLDGQHRTLGMIYALEALNTAIQKTRTLCDSLQQNAAPKEVLLEQEHKLQSLLNERHRISEEIVSIDIVEVNNDQAAQIFGDINNNAKGVNADFTTVLDKRDVVNRLAMDLIQSHTLLKDRVELGQGGRMSSANINYLGARSVADIVRTVLVGTGRMTPRVVEEVERAPEAARLKAERFFDLLLSTFVELQDMVEGKLTPRDLRGVTMLGSATMLRALAAAYHSTTNPDPGGGQRPLTADEFGAFLAKLAGPMRRIPIQSDDRLWLDTGAFVEGGAAPLARQGSYKRLTEALTDWAVHGVPRPRRKA
jgi:hypothetical protein